MLVTALAYSARFASRCLAAAASGRVGPTNSIRVSAEALFSIQFVLLLVIVGHWLLPSHLSCLKEFATHSESSALLKATRAPMTGSLEESGKQGSSRKGQQGANYDTVTLYAYTPHASSHPFTLIQLLRCVPPILTVLVNGSALIP